ncbi:hypothetical protein [Mameliella alba]|uniref:hypothetical protein n=1 Tax=Mameliella alba TaxID=561184 RepID=UPI0013E4B42D|nr:hypothetical protein [Mameliella alba]BBU57422.1 hypothetical protein KU6B_36870 [Mameliella alba]
MSQDFRSPMERDAWRKVEGLAEFHWKDLEEMNMCAETAQKFMRRWARLGWIRVSRKDGHRKIYVNAARAIPVVPAVKADPTPEGNMWRAMRRMPNFTPTDLAAHANAGGVEVTVEKARSYCRSLLAAGYLKVRETAIPGRRQPRYQLIRNTGPQAPVVRRVKGLMDPNEGEFQPLNGGTS